MTSLTPGRVMSATDLMCAGLSLGTISTSVFVANSAGFSTSPLARRAAGCLLLAAANTSAGAPCSMSVSSAPDPPNVYFALGAICGKTLVSEAAASTVGPPLPPLAAVLDPVLEPAPDDCAVVVLLALPQPAIAVANPIASATANARRSRFALKATRSSSTSCQNPGSIP